MRWFAGALLGALAALAFGASVRASGTTLIVNESRVLEVKTANAGTPPQRRVEQMANNMRAAAGEGFVSIKSQRRESQLMIGNRLIARVTEAEARAHGVSVATLARGWAERINAALRLPPLQLDAAKLQLPPDGQRMAKLLGSEAHAAELRSSDPAVATVTRTEGGILVRAAGVGVAEVVVSAGEREIKLPVEVLPWAVDLRQSFEATVTGSPAQQDAVRSAVLGAVRTRLVTQPGARVDILGTDAASLASGSMGAFSARVRVFAPGAFTREGKVPVTVRNLPVGLGREAELWYCNDPENVQRPGNLFAAPLARSQPARLLYHHINKTRAELTILVWVRNPSDQPARLAIIPGDGDPHTDPVRVGIDAAQHYLKAWLTASGHVIELPARSAAPIALRRLAPEKTMSGLCTLKLLDDGPERLIVSTDAMPASRAPAAWMGGAGSLTPWAYSPPRALDAGELIEPVLTDHVYPTPFRSIDAAFDVGGRHTFIRIGQAPIPNLTSQRELYGNFGVVYQVRATLRNTTHRPANVEVAFEASAGYSGALFVVDGKLDEPKLLQSKQEFLVRTIRLGPGEERKISLMTVPLSGSSYPATLTLREPDPMAVASRGGRR